MDHIDEYLTTACRNFKLSKAIRAALALAKQTLNRYYNKTDHSDVYRIAMGSSYSFIFLFISFSSLLQSFTLVTNYSIFRKPDGKILGLKPLARLSVPNLIKLMHLWMLKNNSLTLLLLP
jgi:hypothetical protein